MRFFGAMGALLTGVVATSAFAANLSLAITIGPDPALVGQWWVDELQLPEVWQLASGKGVVMAACDSGYYVNEPDLAPNLDLARARDLADKQRPHDVSDGSFLFHGTAAATLAVGARDGRGVNGIAYNAKLVPLQYFNFDRSLDDVNKEEGTARCINYALSLPDVRIIIVQNSTAEGSAERDMLTRDLIRKAVERGVVVVLAAGNQSLELDREATVDTGSIIVGALRQDGRGANFSNYGDRVTTSAFGENILTLYGPEGRLDVFGGTTAATAQVAATVALMLEVNPGLTPSAVRDMLVATRNENSNNWRVGGQLNILAAVQAAEDSLRYSSNFVRP